MKLSEELQRFISNLLPTTKYAKEIYTQVPEIKFKMDPRITFFGTISMKPTSYKAVSCIHLNLEGKGVLLDCGEGSFGQIYDHF